MVATQQYHRLRRLIQMLGSELVGVADGAGISPDGGLDDASGSWWRPVGDADSRVVYEIAGPGGVVWRLLHVEEPVVPYLSAGWWLDIPPGDSVNRHHHIGDESIERIGDWISGSA